MDGPVIGSNVDSRQSCVNQFGESTKSAHLSHNFVMTGNVSGRIRPSVRGTSKRGRPRGSRRGGPVGGKGRGLFLFHSSSKGTATSSQSSSTTASSVSSQGDQSLQHGKILFLLKEILFNRLQIFSLMINISFGS